MDFDKRDLIKKGDDFYDICQKKLVSDEKDENHIVSLKISKLLFDYIKGLEDRSYVDSFSKACRALLVLGFNKFRQMDIEYVNYIPLANEVLEKYRISIFDEGLDYFFSSTRARKRGFKVISYIDNAIDEMAMDYNFESKSDLVRFLLTLGLVDEVDNDGVQISVDNFGQRLNSMGRLAKFKSKPFGDLLRKYDLEEDK